MTAANLRGLPRDEGGGPGAGAAAPAAVPATETDGVLGEPMNARKSHEKAVQKMMFMKQMMQVVDPGSMVDDSMPELRRGAEALGADAVALAEPYSASGQRAGAFGLSAGVAMDLRLGWDLGQRADQVKAEKRLNDSFLSPRCLTLSRLQHAKPDELAELREESRANVIWSLHAV